MRWPADYRQAWTLASSVERSGVGLHDGQLSRVKLQPARHEGYWVGWLSDGDQKLKRLSPDQVCETSLCTALDLGGKRLATVEHLLAALAGTGVTHAEILVDGEEIPLLDGSALPWVEAIAEAGLSPIGERRLPPLSVPCLTVRKGESFAVAMPCDKPILAAAIEFPQPAIGRQLFSIELTPADFVEQIAPARTFGFKDQVDQLLARGLIRGGALDNALVCDGERWLNPPLRFPDEPVRHKLLDLLGDLALAGLPRAQVFAYRGSHGLHTELSQVLAEASSAADTPSVPLPLPLA